ncbi:hypothetical protein FZEAL_9694 [Fusarium zealandicum]|uniref:Uncharacterized protein n=1 Tax=Fusarium zealandicum TaxID=1053134 RepID=A0A8H4XEC4_9HYPO|nr:hypothetical protein FZEAL_9694 [Fusarium zealandicum]
MLPVKKVMVRLVSVDPQPQDQQCALKYATKHASYHSASVLHADNYGAYSLITKKLLNELFKPVYGSEERFPDINMDTVVCLQWHYPALEETQVTKHLVLDNAAYDVVLRKEDWETPIRNWLLRDYTEQQLREHRVLPPLDEETQDKSAPLQLFQQGKCQRELQAVRHMSDDSACTVEPQGQQSEMSGCESCTSTSATIEPQTPSDDGLGDYESSQSRHDIDEHHQHTSGGEELAKEDTKLDCVYPSLLPGHLRGRFPKDSRRWKKLRRFNTLSGIKRPSGNKASSQEKLFFRTTKFPRKCKDNSRRPRLNRNLSSQTRRHGLGSAER